MAGGQERILRRRIKSVQSTKKITRAMELIAATRVVKAQERAHQARPYAEQITNVITDLSEGGASIDHPLLRESGDTGRVALLVVTSDRGLCGAYNSSVLRAAETELDAVRSAGRDYALVLVGKKAQKYFSFRGYDIEASFADMTDQPTYEDARDVARHVRGLFEDGTFDTVDLIYTRFVSAGSQRVVVRRFLPLEVTAEDESLTEQYLETPAVVEFEPSPEGILDQLLPRYVEARVFAALLDASASEHAARQRAMKSATDNAEDLIVALARRMNRARQDAITTEIMEVVGGAEALDDAGPTDLLPDHLLPEHLLPDHLDVTPEVRPL